MLKNHIFKNRMLKNIFFVSLGLMTTSAFANNCPEGRMYKHELGETCVPKVPQHVVTLEYSFIDDLGVLNEKPIGYAKDNMPQYLDIIVADSTQIGPRKAPSLEKIAELKPDLIIADLKRHSGIYEQLSAIAPTLVYNSLRGSYEEQMRILKQIGNIYKKEDVAIKAINNLEAKMVTIQAEASPATVLLDVYRPGSQSIHSDKSFMGSLMSRIGKTNPMQVRDGKTQYDLSLEGIAKVNPDQIIIFCTSQSQASIDKFINNPVVKSLKAFKDGNVYFLNKTLWSKGRGVLGLNHILEEAKTSGFLSNQASTNRTCKSI